MPDAAPLSPLLVTCARVAVGTATPADLARAARAVTDWPLVLQQSIDHRMSPLLHKQLSALDPSPCPPEAATQLLALYRAGVQRGLFLATQLLRLLDLFAAAGVTALPYKGPVLAVQAYGDPGLRAPNDLDLLVARKDVPQAVEVLLRQGFTRMGGWPAHRDRWVLRRIGELTFESPLSGVIVELHTRIGFLLDSTSISSEHLLDRATTVELMGRSIVAPSVDDTLLVLCVHASRHDWDRLEWVLAAGLVMGAMTSDQWRGFLDEARRWACLRRGLVGARVVSSVLALRLPPEIEATIARDRLGSVLARAILWQLREGRTDGVRDDLRGLALVALSEDTFRSALENVLHRLFTPGVEDWAGIELGAGLTPLYWPLRVLRLAVKHAGMAARSAASARGRAAQ